MNKLNSIWPALEEAARTCESWADFSSDLFSGQGLLAQMIPDPTAQRAFVASKENQVRLRGLFEASVEKNGLIEGSQPTRKNANMLIRLPQSLHSELKQEAEEEGVSLNQLVILKLAAQLKRQIYQRGTEKKTKSA